MSILQPSFILSGRDLSQINKNGVYAWIRGDEFLYIGVSSDPVRRVAYHNIIGKAELILPDDVFQFWSVPNYQEAMALEQSLIFQHKPKYNGTIERGVKREVQCISCGVAFMQKRWWQRFCSDKCRNGSAS